MKSDDQLIKKMFRGIMITNVISIVAGIGCTMIDAIVTGKFLGTDAVAASGLIMPVVLAINLIGGLVGGGIGTVCTRYMGKALPDRVNQVYSIVLIALVITAIAEIIVVFFGAPWFGQVLGAKTGSEEIVHMVRDYLVGFCPAILCMRITIALSAVMIIDNDKNRSIMAMAATFVSDFAFDLANALIFHGGMFGMAVATSLSNVVGLLVVLTHFLRKDCMLRFTTKGLKLSDLKDVVLCGVPSAVNMGSQSLRTLVFNMLLLSIAGKDAVAALSVCNSAFSVVNAVALGMFFSAAVISSLLYGEEDRSGLEKGISIAIKNTLIIFGILSVIMIAFPRQVASFFVQSSAEAVMAQGAVFIRFMAVQFLIMVVVFPVSGFFQGTRNIALNYLIDLLREGILPILCVMGAGAMMGINGVSAGFVLSGILTLLACILIAWKCNKKIPVKPKDFLVLPDHFGAKPDELLELSLHSPADVVKASEKVMGFCREKGADNRTSYMLSLFVEEMTKNTFEYGFPKGKDENVDVRILYREGSGMIRFRDNGVPFDPVEWMKLHAADDAVSGIGIRMTVKLAKKVDYVATMEMNNLIIQL